MKISKVLSRKYQQEYRIWHGMKQRCLNSKNSGYKNYGGRGIKVCQEWLESFECFLMDMGRRPSPKHSIERMNNNGDYTPENCTWATRKEQANNTRVNVMIEFQGVTYTPMGLARRLVAGGEIEFLGLLRAEYQKKKQVKVRTKAEEAAIEEIINRQLAALRI